MKKLIVNTAMCDIRNISEETLKQYSDVVIDTAILISNSRANELLHRYSVRIDTADTLLVEKDVPVSCQNGSFTLHAGCEGEGVLMINGQLLIEEGSMEGLCGYEKIHVNGNVLIPRSMRGKLSNLSVNGSITEYPDGAIRLRSKEQIDKTFPLRAKNALYYASRELVFMDAQLNAAVLAEKGVRFETCTAIIKESLVEGIVPLLDDRCHIRILADDIAYLPKSAGLTSKLITKYGTKLYVDGDVTVKEKEALEKLEYLIVKGTLSLEEGWKDSLDFISELEYKELNIVPAPREGWGHISGKIMAIVDKALMVKFPEGLLIEGCATVTIRDDIPLDWVQDKLSIRDCGSITCSQEQRGSVVLIAETCGAIGENNSKIEKQEENTQVIDATNYTF